MGASKLTSKGQVTIPAEVRSHLSLQPGDTVEFVVLENGTVMVRPAYVDVMDLAGCLARPKGKRLSVSEMHEIIKERAGKKHDRH